MPNSCISSSVDPQFWVLRMDALPAAYACARVPSTNSPLLRVGVLVDLPRQAQSGGHVKCWERFAEAALDFPDRLDLTVHFMGEQRRRQELGANVRYVMEPPVFSTGRLPFLTHVPDHTDLAPWHPALARVLPQYDVIHTTDAYFAYARTARRVAAREGIALVNSIHTNTPDYTRIYTALTIERLFGRGTISQFLLDRLALAERAEQRMLRQLADHNRRSAFVFVSRPDQLAAVSATVAGRAGPLRRGIDRAFFNPAKRDRQWLAAEFGIAPEHVVLLFVGRLNRGKNVLLLAEAVAALIERGLPLHLICAGAGEERPAILERLGPRASCPGNVDRERLARLYASADLFTFPSAVEEYANVVLEALSSGLPALVSREGGMGRVVEDGRTGLILPADDPAGWGDAIAALADDPARRCAMAGAARAYAEARLPSWADVLAQDLLPHWQQAAQAGRPAVPSAAGDGEERIEAA
jgi:glycosyltransferase involved in cell wall biosynthesis